MKFSIRDLFLVTMIVALAVGWGVDRWRLREEMALQRMRHQTEKEQWEANLEKAKSSLSTLNKINDGFSRALSENAGRDNAFREALDEAAPGWRDANGSYKTLITPGGGKR